jgi:hypothetical protein
LLASLSLTGSPKKEIEAIYPLSPLQEGLLFHSLYDNSSSMYVSHLSCALGGELDVDSLQAGMAAASSNDTMFCGRCLFGKV